MEDNDFFLTHGGLLAVGSTSGALGKLFPTFTIVNPERFYLLDRRSTTLSSVPPSLAAFPGRAEMLRVPSHSF
jgi:hypothetical protein